MITPNALAVIGGNTVLVTLGITAFVIGVRKFKTAWASAVAGEPTRAAATTTALILLLISLTDAIPTHLAPDWPYNPITDFPNAFYTITVYLLPVVLIATLVLSVAYILTLIKAVAVWLAAPSDEPWEGVSNRHRLYRKWCLHRAENSLGQRALAHAATYSSSGSVTLTRDINAGQVTTTVHADPPLQQIGRLLDLIGSSRWVKDATLDHLGDAPVVRVQWDVAAMDDAAPTFQNPGGGTWTAHLGQRRLPTRIQSAAGGAAVAALVAVALATSQSSPQWPMVTAGGSRSAVLPAPEPGGDPIEPAPRKADPDQVLSPDSVGGDACTIGPHNGRSFKGSGTGPHEDSGIGYPDDGDLNPTDPCNTAGFNGDTYTTTFMNPKIVTAVAVLPDAIDFLRIPKFVIFRFDDDPSNDVAENIGLTGAWNRFDLPTPRQATMVRMFVARAVPAPSSRTPGHHHGDPLQIIGHDMSAPTVTAAGR